MRRKIFSSGTPHNSGVVLKSLLDQGAQQVGELDQCHAVAIDARAPRCDGGIASRIDGVPFSLVVNKDGQRFYDEGEDFWPKRYAIWGRLVAQQPDQVAYAILDEAGVRRFMPSVFSPISADTIEDLALALGLDPAALRKLSMRLMPPVPKGRSTSRSSMARQRRGSSRRKPTGLRRLSHRPSPVIRSSPGSPLPIWALR